MIVNVNIKMLEKGKIKMYNLFLPFFLSRFNKSPLFFEPV